MSRVFDILVSLVVLILFLPIGLLIAVVLIFTGEGLVFFRQTRIGYRNKPFDILKFVISVY